MKDRYLNIAIAVVSVAVPLVVLMLYAIKPTGTQVGFDLKILPALNASLNFSTAVLLCFGYYFIRNKQWKSHRLCMITAFILSVIFLSSYLYYHSHAQPTHYGGQGVMMYIYFTLLILHIILAAVIVPLVLITLVRGLSARYDKHRKIARYTFPLWLFVALSGVVVYLMLKPYY